MTSIPRHILLIDDDAPNAMAILEILNTSSEGSYQVDWVRHCSEGLAKLPATDAILLDLSLTDCRGIETFDRFYAAAPYIPILILTRPEDEGIAKLAVERGAQDYLLKARFDGHKLLKSIRNMIERAAISEALFDQKERAQATLNSIGDAVMSTDASGNVTYLNAIAEGLTGWSEEQAKGRPLEEVFKVVDGTTRKTVPNPMALAIRENKTVALTPNCVLIRRDGKEAPIEDSVAPIHDRRGAITGAVMVFHDVSVARAVTLKMSYLAQHDSLTDLPNRVLMNDRLIEAITLSKRHKRKLAVLFVDLDRFKHINDSLGHVVGDRLLQSVARRLVTCVRSSDTVSRNGGDEFLILLWEERCAQDAAITAEKILQALREPHHIDSHVLNISASIGVVTYPDDGTDAETLLNNADIAMYHAKDTGRNNYQFFKPEMNELAVERQSLESDLHLAIERKELLLHYQPIVDLTDGAIIGVEALLRWRHPRRGLVPPVQFIGIAEECGLIVPIGQWILREACLQASAWRKAGVAPMCMAINVSPVQLRSPSFASNLRAILKETGVEPRYLELELTETFLLDDSNSTAAVLDDFGTGYSSLTYLKRFPIDALKIDRSFVKDLITDADDASIVTAVIGMGKSLNMLIVAEGVETQEQLEFLQKHHCPQGQGFYFSRPAAAADIGDLLKQGLAGSEFAPSARTRARIGVR